MKPLLIAHRGDTVNFQENTIEAFQSAFDHGADGIEFDVHVNDKGQAIIVHDYLYDKNKKYPFLQTVLEKFSHQGFLEIEIKNFEVPAIKKVTYIIKKYNPPNYAIISSVLPLLYYVRKELPQAKIGAIIKPYLFEKWMTKDFIERKLLGYMNLTTANVAMIYLENWTESLAIFLKKEGFLIHSHLYTDDLKEYQKAVGMGFDSCTFDNVNLLKKIKRG